jgi:hypothetical protein
MFLKRIRKESAPSAGVVETKEIEKRPIFSSEFPDCTGVVYFLRWLHQYSTRKIDAISDQIAPT